MRKTFLQLYNEIFENKNLKQIEKHIIEAIMNLMTLVSDANLSGLGVTDLFTINNLKQRFILNNVNFALNGIQEYFKMFWEGDIRMYYLISNTRYYLRQLEATPNELGNFTNEYNRMVQELINYFELSVMPIGAASDLIVDKQQDRTFTKNTIDYILTSIRRQLDQIYDWFSPGSSVGNELKYEIGRFANENVNFNKKDFKNYINRLKRFFDRNYILIRNDNQRIELNPETNEDNSQMSNYYRELQNILDQVKFI